MRMARFAGTAKPVNSVFPGPLVLILALAVAMVATVGAWAGEALQRLEFVTETGPHAFRVEVADTMQERAKGLMFRRSMPQDQGMLFNFHEETPVMMWMKNTYIPLDMVFVSREGVVTRIAADTTPMSEAVIDGGRVYAVVELNAGAARRIGLKPGDEVRHATFRN